MEFNRRTVIKAITGGLTLSLVPLPFRVLSQSEKVELTKQFESDLSVSWSACMVNCGSRCALRVFTKNNIMVRVETDNTGTDEYGDHQVRACLRGRSMRQRVYSKDRIRYPMKRVGPRGSGQFEKITWEELYETITQKTKAIISKYGNESIFMHYGYGTFQRISGRNAVARFLNLTGGYLKYHNTYSAGQLETAMPYTYGRDKHYFQSDGSYMTQIANAALYVSFGNNPAETRTSGGGQMYELLNAKDKNNTRMILIDPRYSDTALGKEDLWIPIRPGTDAALVEGIAYLLITENKVDQQFLDKYCIGYDETTLPATAPKNGHYKAHILGYGADGIAKTPAWASDITGIPIDQIIKLAREIGDAKPCFISQGWSVQRQANGEQSCRAIAMLPILTGNVGLPGTNTGSREGDSSLGYIVMPIGNNPVKASIPSFLWTDAIARGSEMTAAKDGIKGVDQLSTSIKLIWNFGGNVLVNQHSDINRTTELLQDETKCELIIVADNQMTPSAKYADLLIPDTTNLEVVDIVADGYASGALNYLISTQPAIPRMFDTKPIYEVCQELAKRFGKEKEFTDGHDMDGWTEYLYDKYKTKYSELPSYQDFVKQGLIRIKPKEDNSIRLKGFRDDPVANPLSTPSGKIEIYSEKLANEIKTMIFAEGDSMTPIPQYTQMWESYADPLTKIYPLQLIGIHFKGRVHSTYHNVPWLREVAPDELWINPIDAKIRGIKSGDDIHIFNDRGRVKSTAKVTPRIMPGVIAMPQGAWYKPDKDGVCQGSSMNVLTNARPSPLAKSNPQQTNLVNIVKITNLVNH